MVFKGIVHNGESYCEHSITSKNASDAFKILKDWSSKEYPWCEYVEGFILLDERSNVVAFESKYGWSPEHLKEFIDILNNQRKLDDQIDRANTIKNDKGIRPSCVDNKICR